MSTPPRRRVTGRLVFLQAGPLRGLGGFAFVAVRPHGILPDEKVDEGETRADGSFSLELPDLDGTELIRLKLMETVRSHMTDGTPVDTPTQVRSVDLTVAPETTDTGIHGVAWWPYRTDFPTPRAARVDGELPQAYSRGFMAALASSAAKSAPAGLLLNAKHLLDADGPSMAEIQSHQPETLTIRVEKEHPGRTRSDAWLGDLLLNGFDVALQVGVDTEAPDHLRVRIAWGEMPAKDTFDLTDVDVQLDARGEQVLPTRIIARVRQPGANGAWKADVTHVVTPADGAKWEEAKRIVRCQYLLHGALDGHITRTHLVTEMFAIAAHRTLRHNPVRNILFPHLEEIVPEGADGDTFAWGPRGLVVEQSALTLGAVQERMRRNLAGWDWRGFRPRAVLHPTHRYAKAAHLYWEVLGEYVEAFFLGHARAILNTWREIRAFSYELVDHALPYERLPEDPLVRLAHRDEEGAADLPRRTVDGAVRALRPVTSSPTPQPGEYEALQELCRFILFQSTFNHTWTHDGEYDMGGELAYATFGLRNGSFGAVDDPTIAPPPALAIKAMGVNTLGYRANYGYILADEEKDVPPALKAVLLTHATAFARLGVDVAKIRSRINI